MSLLPSRVNLRLLSLLAGLAAGVSSSLAASAPLPLWSASANQASLYPFLSAADKATGAAIVILPHADYTGTNADNEGAQLARWLNERGVAAFVLRGRTGADAAADLHRAVRTVRAQAAQHKISPTRIGVVAFGRGAEVASQVVYTQPLDGKADAADPVEKLSSRPDLLTLVWGATAPETIPATSPTTLLIAATSGPASVTSAVDLWTKLRGARVPVDAHFFTKAEATSGLGGNHLSLSTWPEIFHTWIRFQGLLTDEPRVPLKGMVYLDGNVLPHGYVIFTPVDKIGAGPIVGRVFNSTASEPIGLFSVPVKQGPVPGRYKVDVRQNMNRWLSNSFSGDLVGGRGAMTPEKAHFGHHRLLGPTIEDQKSFTKVRPSDRQDYIIEIKPDPAANLDLKIEVFSK